VPPPIHFHPGWSRLAEGFGHGGYYAGDGRYRYVDRQQDRSVSGHENQTVQNTKPDNPVSSKIVIAPGCRHEREAPKDGSSTDQPGSSQERTRSRSESLANGEVKPDAEKSSKKVATEQDRVPEAKAENKIEAGTSSR
jgi:hypothetical protein